MELQIEKKREFPIDLGVYNKSLLSRKIYIPFKKVNKNIKELLEKNIKKKLKESVRLKVLLNQTQQ